MAPLLQASLQKRGHLHAHAHSGPDHISYCCEVSSVNLLRCHSERSEEPHFRWKPKHAIRQGRFPNIETIVISTEAAHAFVSSAVEKSASPPRLPPNQNAASSLFVVCSLVVIPQESVVAFALALF
jgi:hypothetical protein